MKVISLLTVAAFTLTSCTTAQFQDPRERRRKAVHEAGHVVLIRAFPQTFKLVSSTIDGTPETKFSNQPDLTDEELRENIMIALAGQAAEDMFPYGSSGSSFEPGGDDAEARDLAQQLVDRHPGLDRNVIIGGAQTIAAATLTVHKAELTQIANMLLHNGHL